MSGPCRNAGRSLEGERVRHYLPRVIYQGLHAAALRAPGLTQRLGQAGVALAQRTAHKLAFRMRCGVLKTDVWRKAFLSLARCEWG